MSNRREWTTIHREGLSVLGKDSGLVKLFHDEHDGHVSVFAKGDSKGQAGMGVTEYGNGGVKHLGQERLSAGNIEVTGISERNHTHGLPRHQYE